MTARVLPDPLPPLTLRQAVADFRRHLLEQEEEWARYLAANPYANTSDLCRREGHLSECRGLLRVFDQTLARVGAASSTRRAARRREVSCGLR